jgi:hypothetical protein
LEEAELWADPPIITSKEMKRIRKLEFPGDIKGFRLNNYPNTTSSEVKRWRNDHQAKLRQLERAAKY